MDTCEVRELNMYREGDSTHFGQPIMMCNIKRLWDEMMVKLLEDIYFSFFYDFVINE